MRVSNNRLFKLVAFIIFFITSFIAAAPLINVSDLQFPERIDSTSVSNAHQQLVKQLGQDSSKDQQAVYYNPSSLNLTYKNLSVKVDKETTLKCWLIEGRERKNAPLIIMLHDINEGKISLLPTAGAFADRGFNVCLVDMRAHGESSGNSFTLGNLERYDIAKLADSVIKYTDNTQLVLMGIGIGANIAIQASVINKNIKCLVLQSPTDSLSHYVQRYSCTKWGILGKLFNPIMLRSLNKDIGYNMKNVVMSKIISHTRISVSVIAGIYDDVVPVKESYQVFQSCPSTDKEYWPVRDASHFNIAEKAGAEYYNHLAFFINSAFPKTVVKKSRFRKLA